MDQVNDLTGLRRNGFQNGNEEFDPSVFADSKVIDTLRFEIRKYFSKTKTFYRNSSSYGLKHIAEDHIGTYVSNGEFIYAMHLEGFRISRETINCYFNISKQDVDSVRNSKTILAKLSKPLGFEINWILSVRKKYQKFKYHLKCIVDINFSSDLHLKRNVINVISREINVDRKIVRSWFDTIKDDDFKIPDDKMAILERIFNLPQDKLQNNI